MSSITKPAHSLTEDKVWLGRFSPLISLSAFYLVLSLLSRFILWSLFSKDAGMSFLHLPVILTLGLLNDFVMLVYAAIPATLYLSLLPTKYFNSSVNRRFLQFVVTLSVFGMLYLCAAEYFFFEEFNSRFNLVSVDYLIHSPEVLINIWDSYPVVWYLLGTFIMTASIVRVLWPDISNSLNGSLALNQRIKLLGVHLALLLAIHAGVSVDTLAVSASRTANELSANRISSFLRAFQTNHTSYNAFYRMIDPERTVIVTGAAGNTWRRSYLSNF